ncbi:3-oxoacyl-ACP reductase FabG [Chlamydiifrater phoenicopteri]|uniref:3-oxoacyl-ACP reductase FabG n=1 Tax=Chlamydiifrater phoenicopteri TaxID=2681469 RepID=UPI001BCB02E4|nr:3-oxoacyl-ACP reductase FabG [Chlamydiifrater phoenicopteri]
MKNFLEGKKAIVTGGNRGIGFGIAKAFVEHGATVEIWGTNESGCQKAAEELLSLGNTGGVSYAKVDVTSLPQIQEAMARFLERHGGLDILVNNAGITKDNLLMKMSEEEWNAVIQTNLSSVFYTCSSAIRHMMKARSGSIINITSIVGKTGNPGQTNYAASKAGIIGFSKALAKEVGSRNIRVNCIAPGYIQTDMTAVLKEELKAAWIKMTPLARLGSVEDIAGAALFLASPWSSYITSQVITVDGGITS